MKALDRLLKKPRHLETWLVRIDEVNEAIKLGAKARGINLQKGQTRLVKGSVDCSCVSLIDKKLEAKGNLAIVTLMKSEVTFLRRLD